MKSVRAWSARASWSRDRAEMEGRAAAQVRTAITVRTRAHSVEVTTSAPTRARVVTEHRGAGSTDEPYSDAVQAVGASERRPALTQARPWRVARTGTAEPRRAGNRIRGRGAAVRESCTRQGEVRETSAREVHVRPHDGSGREESCGSPGAKPASRTGLAEREASAAGRLAAAEEEVRGVPRLVRPTRGWSARGALARLTTTDLRPGAARVGSREAARGRAERERAGRGAAAAPSEGWSAPGTRRLRSPRGGEGAGGRASGPSQLRSDCEGGGGFSSEARAGSRRGAE